jgi:hypothetical protein
LSLAGAGRRELVEMICPDRHNEIFLAQALNSSNQLESAYEIGFSAHVILRGAGAALINLF